MKMMHLFSAKSSKSGQKLKIRKRLKPLKLLSLSLFYLLRHGGNRTPDTLIKSHSENTC
nr:MAG TPA: hypothetical protein [Caudoviricetes sp.]